MRLYKVHQDLGFTEDKSEHKSRTAFMPTRKSAKGTGREWNDGHMLTKNSGITVEEVVIEKGKDNLLTFINSLVGHKYKAPEKRQKKAKKTKAVPKKVTKKK